MSLASAASFHGHHHGSPPRVHVVAYMEALCSDTQRFFRTQMEPAYRAFGPDVIDLRLVPSGNTKLEHFPRLACQHGAAECDANLWEQCAVEKNDPPVYFEFVACLFETLEMGHRDGPLFDESLFLGCADAAGADRAELANCHEEAVAHDGGYEQQKQYVELTPAHDFIPHVIVNGENFDVEQGNLTKVVCAEYAKGDGRHPACEGHLTEVFEN